LDRKRVKSLQRCLVYRLGERRQLKGPGLIFVLPCIDRVDFIDLEREEFTVVQDESFLTADGSLIEIPQFRVAISVANAIKSFTKLKDSQTNVKGFIRLTFKNLVTSKTVEDFERKLDSIMSTFAADCNFYLNNWGWQMDVLEL
jgi:erythrocyte band 7 integral membrane protein